MRYWSIASLLFLHSLFGCAQESSSSRRGPKKVNPSADESETTKSGKTKKSTEKQEASSDTASDFCSGSLALTALSFDPEDKILKIDGKSVNLCALFKDTGKKVLMFQVVAGDCSDCSEKIFRTKNYFSLSSLQSHIEHIVLFHSSEPSPADIDKLTSGSTTTTAFDLKNALVKDTSLDAAQNGTLFILINSNGDMESHSSDKYLEAISKAEALAQKLAVTLPENIPTALQASKIKWDGLSMKSNKQFTLVIAE